MKNIQRPQSNHPTGQPRGYVANNLRGQFQRLYAFISPLFISYLLFFKEEHLFPNQLIPMSNLDILMSRKSPSEHPSPLHCHLIVVISSMFKVF